MKIRIVLYTIVAMMMLSLPFRLAAQSTSGSASNSRADAVATININPSPTSPKQKANYRVVWQSLTTGFKGHGSWIAESLAFSWARSESRQPARLECTEHGLTVGLSNGSMVGVSKPHCRTAPLLRYWVEERRRFLFIPIAPKRIQLGACDDGSNPAGGYCADGTAPQELHPRS